LTGSLALWMILEIIVLLDIDGGDAASPPGGPSS
jgi:hypothetical protein